MKKTEIKVALKGIRPIMFDRFISMDSKVQHAPVEKLYIKDGSIIIPSLNIMSFLSGTNTESAPKRMLDSRKYKAIAAAAMSFVQIKQEHIFLTREGKKIKENDFIVQKHVARLAKGVPNPKERPVIVLPWEISFDIIHFENNELDVNLLYKLFDFGGLSVGLGTYRGVYGKFIVDKWATR